MDLKTYQKMKIIFFQHIRNLNIIEKENNHLPIINDTKNENFREKLKNIIPPIIEIKNKKSKDFEKALKKFKNSENYEFKNILIERHFLFKAVQEVNEELTKNKGFLIDFTGIIHKSFNEHALFYWRMKGYITEDEVLGINLVDEDF